jgi:hypothetical protein
MDYLPVFDQEGHYERGISEMAGLYFVGLISVRDVLGDPDRYRAGRWVCRERAAGSIPICGTSFRASSDDAAAICGTGSSEVRSKGLVEYIGCTFGVPPA